MNSLKNCSDALNVAIRKGIALPGKIKFFFSLTAFAFMIHSCGPSKEEMAYREKSALMADSVANYMPGLATDTINGVTHNFIRNASLKCKVKDVLTATKLIEDVVSINGGYASNSELASGISYKSTIRFKRDSTIEQVHYTTTSTIKLRVPNKQLDTVLRKITDMALFVDFRTLKSDDVKMKLFANAMAETRLYNYKKRVENKVDTKNDSKLNHIIAAEENVLNKQAEADDRRIASYDLADQVNYSTLVIELYEAQKIISEKTAAAVVIEPYTPPFSEKLGKAFLQGFELLKSFILVITQSWGIIFIIVVIVFSGRKLIALYNKRFISNAK